MIKVENGMCEIKAVDVHIYLESINPGKGISKRLQKHLMLMKHGSWALILQWSLN